MIKVVTGCMKSGKSEEVLRRHRRAKNANMKAQIFKPDRDRRFEEGCVITRDDRHEECILIPAFNPEYIYSVLDENTELIIIDEVQFFKPKLKEIRTNEGVFLKEYYPIVEIIQDLSDRGLSVIVSGLDMDSERNPFGPMPYLMSIAGEVRKLHAICECCHHSAMYSYADFEKKEQVALGDKEYAVLCSSCYLKLQEYKEDGKTKKFKLLTTQEEDGIINRKIVLNEDD